MSASESLSLWQLGFIHATPASALAFKERCEPLVVSVSVPVASALGVAETQIDAGKGNLPGERV